MIRSEEEMKKILGMSRKELEKEIGMQIVNGQGMVAIKKTINWVLGNKNDFISVSNKYSKQTRYINKTK